MRCLSVLALLLCLLALTACAGDCLHLEMTDEVVAPTCEEQGYTVRRCADCAYTYRTDYVKPTGHSTVALTTAPDCVHEGFTEYVCDCGYRYVADIVAPLGHALTVSVRAPSCNEQGYTSHVCTRCSLTYKSDFVAPAGHDFSVEQINVTPAVPEGISVFRCRTCGYTYDHFLTYSDVFSGAYAPSDVPLAKGVDISYHNHQRDAEGNYLPLDFVAIREAGYDFVILRVGSTPRVENGKPKGGIDPVFEMNYAAAKAAGLDVGVYFYTYSTTLEGTRSDAALVLEWLAGKQLEYPVYFDIENGNISSTLSREEITELCVTFLSILQEHRYLGAVYANLNWLVNYFDTAKVLYLFDVWYARYPSGGAPYAWNTLSYGRTMGMWQYTKTGKIPSVSETVEFDLNYAYKDYPSLIREMGYNGYEIGEK